MAVRYELVVNVEEADIDMFGHVNNIVYVRWMQEVALAHWNETTSAELRSQLVWMALRHEIDYKHPAVLGDAVVLRTWVEPADGLCFVRSTEMYRQGDDKLLAQAVTRWCPIDPKSKRPRRVPAEVFRVFAGEELATDETQTKPGAAEPQQRRIDHGWHG